MEEMDGTMEDGRKRGGQLEGEVFFQEEIPMVQRGSHV